jgi:hypothetical protein
MQHRRIRGLIIYTSRKPERMGEVRGREDFTFTVHSDGKRIFRALCEIEEPAPDLVRTGGIGAFVNVHQNPPPPGRPIALDSSC